MSADYAPGLAATAAHVRAGVVGREAEVELLLAAVDSGRDIVLEGPPGTSKTTMLRAITEAWGIPLLFVEGNAELTPGRLLGHHDPARVLQEGYTPDTFSPGPLVQAMQEGGFLHFEELNRAPEDTLNVLLTAIADREISIPRVGTIHAAPTFRLVGSMNPFDSVGTTRLSISIRDRLCLLEVGYQDEEEEREIVRRRCALEPDDELGERLARDAVAVTRKTRSHEAIRQGSSVRGAIDLALLAARLHEMRGLEGEEEEEPYRDLFFEAMLVALSGRLLLDEGFSTSARVILREVWEDHFILDPAVAEPG
jgi:MoxR-like ATPase